MHHRRLDFEVAARDEELADRLHDLRALDEHVARLRVGDEVDVALPVALLLVGQAVELLRQRPQRLREQAHAVALDRQLAGLRLEQRARRADDVAEVPVLERVERLGADAVERDVELDAPGHVLQRREARLAHHALQHHAAGDGDASRCRPRAPRCPCRRAPRAGRRRAHRGGSRSGYALPAARSAASFARRSAMTRVSSTAGTLSAGLSIQANLSLGAALAIPSKSWSSCNSGTSCSMAICAIRQSLLDRMVNPFRRHS